MDDILLIVLSQTGTYVSRFIRLFTRKLYNHASVALNLSLEEIYSFCRTYRHLPLSATFNREFIGKGTFGLFLTIPCEIYAIRLDPAEKQEFLRYLEHFKKCRSRYSHNILGLCTTFFHIRWMRYWKLHCSEFVVRLLEFTDVALEKSPSLYTPDDLCGLPELHMIYRGELNRYYAMRQRERLHISHPSLECEGVTQKS